MKRHYSRALLLLLCVAAIKIGFAAPAKPEPNPVDIYRNSAPSKVAFALAKDGQALQPIVISPTAGDNIKGLAQEIKKYLDQISGADFEIKTGDGQSGIVLGTLQDFPLPALNKALEIKGNDGREAFAIRTREKRVLLLAATWKGLNHVAYRFLNELGVRWFFPAQQWEVVPQTRDLKFARDITDRPVILNRGIWVSWGFFGNTPEKRWEREWNKARSQIEYLAWGRHNFQGGSFGINTGHAWQEIIKTNNDEFVKHPEYYAMVGGKRPASWESKFEIANPAVRKMVVDYALNYFKNNPDQDMVSVDPSDGGGHSESPEAQKLGSVSDQVFGLANEVAREVAKKYPGKMVGLLAYNFHAMPPSFPLEPNVYVQMPTAFIQGKYSLEDLIERWPAKAKNFGFYDYYSVWLWRHDFLPGGTAANVPALQPKIQDWARRGVTSISAESGNDWGLSGRGYYVAARLMWNPDTDLNALSQDFYDKAFGKGSAAMKRYYERVEGANKNRLSRNTYALALRDVDEAAKAAKDDAGATARIDDIKQYLRYQHLNWEWDRVNTPDTYNVATPAKEIAWNARIEQTYRERFSYMTHFAAQLSNGYADWDNIAKNPDKFPDKPYSRQERDAQWAEMLAAYKPIEIEEKKFSDTLVPVDLGEGGSDTAQHFAGRAGFLLYSNGEPMNAVIQTDALAGFEGRPDARWTLGGEKSETKGRMKFDGGKYDLKIHVPKGVYGFDFDAGAGSWTFLAPKGQHATQMLLQQWPRSQVGPLQDMYFYVPKGTRQIELAWGGGNLAMFDSNGTGAKIVEQNDDTYVFAVPQGTDGKVWKLKDFALGQLWFYNIPNQIAASPASLLEPKDVAQRDSLRIIQ